MDEVGVEDRSETVSKTIEEMWLAKDVGIRETALARLVSFPRSEKDCQSSTQRCNDAVEYDYLLDEFFSGLSSMHGRKGRQRQRKGVGRR